MIIGCVKEVKDHEYRVGLTPDSVQSYIDRGHTVLIEKDAGLNAGFTDDSYIASGAKIIAEKKKIFDDAEMIIKVKEPLPSEYDFFHEDQILFTYLHLAANEQLTKVLLSKNVKSVAYETIETEDGQLPCLKPMSEIAGRLSIQEGAKYLEKPFGGRGVLLGGVPGVQRGKIAILGGGTVGSNACKIATGIGADVTILDINANRLEYLDDIFGSRINTLYSTDANIEKVLQRSDLVIGAVLVPGAKAPHLIKKEHLKIMKPGAVLVDVAVDQGGCAETTKPTTHDNPVYIIDDVVHYTVANMPGVVALSSTVALTSTTLRYGLKIAELGLEEACLKYPSVYKGVNTFNGACVCKNVAKAFDMEFVELTDLLGK